MPTPNRARPLPVATGERLLPPPLQLHSPVIMEITRGMSELKRHPERYLRLQFQFNFEMVNWILEQAGTGTVKLYGPNVAAKMMHSHEEVEAELQGTLQYTQNRQMCVFEIYLLMNRASPIDCDIEELEALLLSSKKDVMNVFVRDTLPYPERRLVLVTT